jgi:hypothetical protein
VQSAPPAAAGRYAAEPAGTATTDLETYFANLIRQPTRHWRVGGELTCRRTGYTLLRNHDGLGFQTQVPFRFWGGGDPTLLGSTGSQQRAHQAGEVFAHLGR